MDILITDCSNNSYDISQRLACENVFDHVFYVSNIRETSPRFFSTKSKFSRFIEYFFTGEYTKCVAGRKYDRLLVYNLNWFSFMLFNTVNKTNPDIKVDQFEEGLISYYLDTHRFDNNYFKKIWHIKKLTRQPIIFDRLESFYCFNPELYKGSLSSIRIPRIKNNNPEFKTVCTRVFDVDADNLSYRQKHIYFASLLDQETDEGPDGELILAKKIAEVVGYDNLLVKLHPREAHPERYIDGGFTVDCNSNIPFEIIQMLYDFSGYTFITTLSGGVLNLTISVENPPKVLFAHKLFHSTGTYMKEVGHLYDRLISDLDKEMEFKSVYVLDNNNYRDILKNN